MKKRIKITKDQLNEFEKNDFSYWDEENDTKPYNISDITADGYKNPKEYGDIDTTDKFAGPQTPQGYIFNRRYGMAVRGICENENTWGDPVNGQNNELDILSNGDEKDNLVRIPKGVEKKTQILIDSVLNLCSDPKQQARVLNKLIENFKLGGIPIEWKKELMGKIMNNHKK